MPWINITTATILSAEQSDKVKAEFAAIMLETLAKEERGLSVTFTDPYAFYRAGEACTDGAVVDIRYIGSFPLEKKREITRRMAVFLNSLAGFSVDKTIVLFSEIASENWGRKGGDFS
jgi:phenylpyruvate tautomerase PptA (4-oxalocrotonate tautomerase family)